MRLFSARIIVLDTETTGFLSDRNARVVELAAVCLDEAGEEVGTFESLVCPDVLSWEGLEAASKVTGITWEEVVAAPRNTQVSAEFGRWVEEQGTSFVTSFNTDFDRPMMDRLPAPEGLRWVSCIMRRSMELMGPAGALRDANPRHPRYDSGRPWLFPKLSAAGEFFGVEPEGDLHRALCDARLAAGVMRELQRRLLDSEAA